MRWGTSRSCSGARGSQPGARNAPFRVIGGIGWRRGRTTAITTAWTDEHDECPELARIGTASKMATGCPDWDNDDDGVPDAQDRCPSAKEDTDGFQDEDGCPDPDNDNDGVPDQDDACPTRRPSRQRPEVQRLSEQGGRCRRRARCDRPVPEQGCLSPDEDGDTFADEVDKCPARRDLQRQGRRGRLSRPGGKPLVVIDLQRPIARRALRVPVKFGGHPGPPKSTRRASRCCGRSPAR